MAQLHFYVSDEVEQCIRAHAKSAGVSVSKYLAQVIQKEVVQEWPESFFESVVGGWDGEPLVRPDQGEFEARLYSL